MFWIISGVVALLVFILIFKSSSSSCIVSSNLEESIPQLLELVNKKGYLIADSYIDSQYSKNKIGWYLNSFNFVRDYNQSGRFKVEVEFVDKVKRIGDVSRIILRLNPEPKPIEFKEQLLVYRSPLIKECLIREMDCKGLTDDKLGKFCGYVRTEKNNKFEKFAIAVFNNSGLHLGYLWETDERLFNTLEQTEGKQQVWGYIYKEIDVYEDEFLHGCVYIPVKCSKTKIEEAVREFKAKRIRKVIKHKPFK